MKTLRVIAIVLAILGLRATTHSQAPAPAPAASRPVFEVASILEPGIADHVWSIDEIVGLLE